MKCISWKHSILAYSYGSVIYTMVKRPVPFSAQKMNLLPSAPASLRRRFSRQRKSQCRRAGTWWAQSAAPVAAPLSPLDRPRLQADHRFVTLQQSTTRLYLYHTKSASVACNIKCLICTAALEGHHNGSTQGRFMDVGRPPHLLRFLLSCIRRSPGGRRPHQGGQDRR